MAAKRLKLGVIVGVLVVTEAGEAVICDTNTNAGVIVGDTVAVAFGRARPVTLAADGARGQRLRARQEQARTLLAAKDGNG